MGREGLEGVETRAQGRLRRQITSRLELEYNLQLSTVSDYGFEVTEDATAVQTGLKLALDMGDYQLVFPVDISIQNGRNVYNVGVGYRSPKGLDIQAGVILDGEEENFWFNLHKRFKNCKNASLGVTYTNDRGNLRYQWAPVSWINLGTEAGYNFETKETSGRIMIDLSPQGPIGLSVGQEFRDGGSQPVWNAGLNTVTTGTRVNLSGRVQDAGMVNSLRMSQLINKNVEVYTEANQSPDVTEFREIGARYRSPGRGWSGESFTGQDGRYGAGLGYNRNNLNLRLTGETRGGEETFRLRAQMDLTGPLGRFLLGRRITQKGTQSGDVQLVTRKFTNPFGFKPAPSTSYSYSDVEIGQTMHTFLESFNSRMRQYETIDQELWSTGGIGSKWNKEYEYLSTLLNEYQELITQMDQKRQEGTAQRKIWEDLAKQTIKSIDLLNEIRDSLGTLDTIISDNARIEQWINTFDSTYRTKVLELQISIGEVIDSQNTALNEYNAVLSQVDTRMSTIFTNLHTKVLHWTSLADTAATSLATFYQDRNGLPE